MFSRLPSGARHRRAHRPVRPRLSSVASALAAGTRMPVALVAAMAATGVAVGAGVAAGPAGGTGAQSGLTHAVAEASPSGGATSTAVPQFSAEQLAERRDDSVSRSQEREQQAAERKRATLSTADGPAVTRTEDLSDAAPRTIARRLMPEYGFSASQFGCLDALYVSESNWNVHADNPTSSAYGIPQALTSTHELPANYYTSAVAQIRWGLDYIRDSYGSPCAAWEFKQANNFY